MLLKERFKLLDLQFDEQFFQDIYNFKTTLKQWGAVHNLTSNLTDGFIDDNIVDSLYPLRFLSAFNSMADIGSGAGYPGLVLSISKREAKVYLIEANKKKASFLNFVVQKLKLENTKVLAKKVQLCKELDIDLITSRAVAKSEIVFDISKNIANKDTKYLLYKGEISKDELKIETYKNIKIYHKDKKRAYLYGKL